MNISALPRSIPDTSADIQIMDWLDLNSNPLLSLQRDDVRGQIWITDDGQPELLRSGKYVEVPYSPAMVYVGDGQLRAGSFTQALRLTGDSRDAVSALIGEVRRAAVGTRWIQKGAMTLSIAGFSKVSSVIKGAAAWGAQVSVDFQPALPYWLFDLRSQTVAPGALRSLTVVGDVRVLLTVSITAGSSDVVSPTVLTDAGLTTFVGTIPAGQTLVIDPSPGRWAVTLNGVSVRTGLRGPQPAVDVGQRQIQITAPGASASVSWQEGAY